MNTAAKDRAGKRARIKDLKARRTQQVKGGKVSMTDFHFVKRENKASTSL